MWLTSRLVHRQEWAEGLATFRFDTVLKEFEPGQFLNLSLASPEGRLTRSYSLASAAGEPVEFLVTRTGEGDFTPRLFELQEGEALEVQDTASGFFTLRWVPPAAELWLMASGTGLAPFISILRSDEVWQRFESVVVVHGVRHHSHLAYGSELQQLGAERGLRYVATVTRDPGPSAGKVIHGRRIPAALTEGLVEQAAGLALDPSRSHVMLCGNPAMIDDVSQALAARGLRRHRSRKPGHITTEKYW